MIVTTTQTIPNREIKEILGVAHGIIVRTPTIKQGFFGGFKNIIGGQNSSYTQLCESAREQAYNKLLERAHSLGADAVVGLCFDSSELGGDQLRANEVFVYGTAVRLH